MWSSNCVVEKGKYGDKIAFVVKIGENKAKNETQIRTCVNVNVNSRFI